MRGRAVGIEEVLVPRNLPVLARLTRCGLGNRADLKRSVEFANLELYQVAGLGSSDGVHTEDLNVHAEVSRRRLTDGR